MTPAERDECVRLYRLEGVTLDRLAEIFDRERTTISRLIRRRNANRGWNRTGRFPGKLKALR